MKKFTITCHIVSLIFIIFQTSLAQAMTLTPYIGGYRFEGNSNIGDTITIGLGIDFQLTDNFSTDLIYLRGNSDLNYLDMNNQRCVLQENIDTNIFLVSGRYHFLKNSKFIPFVNAGFGMFSMNTDYAEMFQDDPDQHYLFQFHYGGGIKYLLTETLALRGDFRHLISFENMDNDVSAIVGVSYTFGAPAKKQLDLKKPHKKHTDPVKTEDNVHSTKKINPSEKHVETKKKPTQAEKSKQPPSVSNKPEVQVKTETRHAPLETKQDIKPEHLQKSEPLPQEALETKTSTDHMALHKNQSELHAKTQVIYKPKKEADMRYVDTDADGIVDQTDKCPNTPRNVKVNLFGCAPDQDRDGVIDVLDHCPGTPSRTKVDRKGCRMKAIVIADKFVKDISKKMKQYQIIINFDYKSAEIKQIYDNQIAKIKEWIKKLDHPIIIINSHTDNIGSHIYNINLSDKRAENVKKYLYRHFQVPDHWVKTYGFGETQPIADNNTAEGRQKNRRAEIIVTEKKH